jgi:tetratricopeptide (TPR) repeat protein
MLHKQTVHQWINAPYKQDRENAEIQTISHSYQVDCHRNHRGPYTGAGELLRTIVPGAYQRKPDLVLTHAITLLSVSPEMKSIIPISYELDRSFTNVTSDDGFLSRTRTRQIAHGLVDFLFAYFAQEDFSPCSISFENVHMADPLDQEFIALLLRRADPEFLYLTIHTDSTTPLPEALLFALQTYAQATQIHPMTLQERQELFSLWAIPDDWSAWLLLHTDGWRGELAAWQYLLQNQDLRSIKPGDCEATECLHTLVQKMPFSLQVTQAQIYIESDCTSDNLLARVAYQLLETSLRQQLHTDHVATLEKLDQWSLHLGAIPYHYERASPEILDKHAIQACVAACDFCMVMGYYEAAVDFGYRGRALTDWEKQREQYWLLTKGLISALLLLDRLVEAENLCHETQTLISDPSILMTCAYFMAILYARFQVKEKRDYQLARKWIQEAIMYAESLTEPEKKLSNVNFLQKSTWAFTELRAGHPYEAIQLLSEGIERLRATNPGKYHKYQRDIEIFLYNRGRLYVETNQLERALEDYTAVIGLETYTSEHYFQRGNVLRSLGRYRESLEDYDQAIAWSPPYPEVFYNRASLFSMLGQPERAFADYSYVLDLDPDFVDALVNRAYLLFERGEYAASRKDMEHGLTLKPGNAQLLCILGLLETKENHAKEAYRAFSLALEQDATLKAAWTNRAVLLFAEGNSEAAIADLTHALSISEDATALYNRALAYKSQKRWHEAINDYSRALALSPNDEQDILSQRDQCYRLLEHAQQARLKSKEQQMFFSSQG